MKRKHYKTSIISKFIFGLLLTILFAAPPVNACSCSGSQLTPEERYNQADGFYTTIVTAINFVDEVDKYKTSSQWLDIELTVYKTYKGEEVNTITAKGFANLPVISESGKMSSVSTSCDTRYYIGQQYTILVNNGKEVDLRMCSGNIFEWGYLSNEERDSFNTFLNK